MRDARGRRPTGRGYLAVVSAGLQARRTDVALATLVGRALGGVFYVAGVLRTRRRKALHPQGGVRQGIVVRQGCEARTGVPWMDEPGRDRVLLRLSRATGLPKFLPDIWGLALRIPHEGGGQGDLLLATTGTGALGRFILRPTRRPGRPYGSLFPFRSQTGPVLLAVFPLSDDGTRFELACATLRGAWSRFGVLEVRSDWDDAPDAPLSFDPVLNEVPGLHSYRWAAQLRRFPYAASRRARGAVAVRTGSAFPSALI